MIRKKVVDGKVIKGVFIEIATVETDFTIKKVADTIAGYEIDKLTIQKFIDELKAKKEKAEALSK